MSEEDTSLFTSDTSTQNAFNITPSTLETEDENNTKKTPKNKPAFIFRVNINTETLLEMHIYSIMILIIVMPSLTKTNILHCCNKSYKTPTGVYMTP